ncbi:MAG: nucleoside hydrolase [Mycobacterium sp.]|nr:nucleoside hydrolase [Mycobacterium sp.]
MRQPVFADVDTGVDDAFALVYLLASADADLIGIASTGGNVDVDQVCRNNLGLLKLCGVTHIPVSRGAVRPLTEPLRTAEDTHGPAGLGYAELPPTTQELTSYDAAEAWIRAAHSHPGELVGLATGPLTNLALALRAEPDLPGLLHRLVIMGGAFDYRGNTTPVAEWNTNVDPEAAAEVFDAWGRAPARDLPIVCGLNLTEKVMLTPEILRHLTQAAGSTAESINPLMRVLEDAMRFYFEFHFSQGEGYLAHLHDPLAAAVALDPSLVRTRAATVAVELTGSLTRGMTVADWRGHWGRVPNARVGVDVDPEVFFARFIERVGPFARRLANAGP